MKKSTKDVLILYLINWAVILIGSLILELFQNFLQYALAPPVLAIVSTLAILEKLNDPKDLKKSKKSTTTKAYIRRTAGTIYVCKPLSTDIYYEVKNNRVYKHLTNKVLYEIKGDKIYRFLESKPILIIKGNKLYSPNATPPKYRIEKDKVYEGDFGTKPILSLRSEKDKFNSSK